MFAGKRGHYADFIADCGEANAPCNHVTLARLLLAFISNNQIILADIGIGGDSVNTRRVQRCLLSLLCLIFLSVSIFSGYAIATHNCSECIPNGYAACPIFSQLQNVSRQLTEVSFAPRAWYIALFIILQMAMGDILKRQHTSSLGGLSVKLNC